MSETALVRAILNELTARGVFAFRVNSGGMTAEYKGKRRFLRFNSAPGCSDVLGLLPPTGRFIAIEAKMGKNQLTDAQTRFLCDVQNHGGIALVVRDSTDGMWNAIQEALK